MLGADFSLENGFYRIKKILQPAAGESDHRSPLQVAGIKTGSYLIAVNGKMIDTSQDLWAAFDSIRDPKVRLTINEIASNVGGSDVVVETVETERYLRTFSWMEQNRRIVEAATNGQVGYIYIVNTSPNGYTDFIRQFMANRDKKGVIIDIRYNHGGMTPDPFLELLARERVGFDKTSFGTTFPWPRTTLEGPRVLLMNKLSGSGGDFFAEFFKKRKMGILIGTRTWGGGVGNGGNPSFIDGGTFAIPLFPIYYSDGKLISEGVGTPPDIEVDDFYVMKESIDLDPQLSRAIQEIKKQLKQFSQAE